MALETATYIDALVTSNPAGGDSASTADDHLRLIKAALQRSFPLLDAAWSVSAADVHRILSGTSTFQAQLDTLKSGKLGLSATAVFAQSAGGAASAIRATSASAAFSAIRATSASAAFSAQRATSASAAFSAQFATSASRATNATSADYATSAGYTAAGVTIYTAGITFSALDAGSVCVLDSGSDANFTVPTNATVAFEVGTEIILSNASTGRISVATAVGVTVNSFVGNTIASKGSAALIKINTNEWQLAGTLQ